MWLCGMVFSNLNEPLSLTPSTAKNNSFQMYVAEDVTW